MMSRRVRGVFISDRPLDLNEGAGGDVLLEVTMRTSARDKDIERYLSSRELVEEHKGYREWIVSAKILNANGDVREVSQREEDDLAF